MRHRFAVYRHAGCVIILRNLILGRKLRFIRIGIHHTVLILEPVLIIRRRLIGSNRVQLPAYDQNHGRLQTALPQYAAAIAVCRSNTGELHRQKVEL